MKVTSQGHLGQRDLQRVLSKYSNDTFLVSKVRMRARVRAGRAGIPGHSDPGPQVQSLCTLSDHPSLPIENDCSRQNRGPQDAYALIPAICEYVRFRGKGDFTGAMKVKDLENGRVE